MLKSLKILAGLALLYSLDNTAAHAAGEGFCNNYAAVSVEQYHLAQERGISVSSPRWNGSFDLHKMWCLLVSEDAAQHEVNARQAVLDASASLGPGEEPAAASPADDASAPPEPGEEPAASSSADDTPAPSSSGEELRQALDDFDAVQEIYNRAKASDPTCVQLRRIVEEMRVYSDNQKPVPESFRYSVIYPSPTPEPTIADLAADRIHRVKQVKPTCF